MQVERPQRAAPQVLGQPQQQHASDVGTDRDPVQRAMPRVGRISVQSVAPDRDVDDGGGVDGQEDGKVLRHEEVGEAEGAAVAGHQPRQARVR